MQQQSQQFDIKCHIDNHNCKVKQICLDYNCPDQRLICDKCQEIEIHKHHSPLISIENAQKYFENSYQQNQQLANYLDSLSYSITELIKQLKQIIDTQITLKLNLQQILQNNQLLDKKVNFEKKFVQIHSTIYDISNVYKEEIKKLIELGNSNKEVSSKQETSVEVINQQIQKESELKQGNQYTENDLSTQKVSIKYYLQQAEQLKNLEKYQESLYFYRKALEFDQKNLICYRGIGDCYRLIKEFQEAIPYYDNALQLEKNDIPSLIGKGECLRMLLDYQESKILYEKVLEIDQKNLISRVGLGECLRHQGSFLEAIQQYDKVLEKDEKNIISLYGKGYCLRNIYSYEQAKDCFLKVLDIDQNHQQSKKQRDICVVEIEKKVMATYSYSQSNIVEQQENVFKTDDVNNKGSYNIYHISRSRNPKNNQDHGKTFKNLPIIVQKQPSKRSESFDKKQIIEFCNQADSLKQKGQYEEALKFYQKALDKDPNNMQSLNGKANCLRLLLQFQESLQTLEIALKLNRNTISLYGKGECLRMLKQFEEAEKYYQESLTKANDESQKNDPIVYMNLRGLGDILRAKGEYQKSIKIYEQALSLNPNHILSLIGKAESLRGLGQYQESLVYYKKTLDINKNELMSLSGIGECLRILKNYPEAQKYHEQVLKIDKNRMISLLGLSECLRKQSQITKALEFVNQALSINPHNEKGQRLKDIILKEFNKKQEAINK